ncbi:MAG: hypothetical protein KGV51_06695 [Moraxellaceae bacterium]|nr:hypothetical protein [Moraxellaceae bacterium]
MQKLTLDDLNNLIKSKDFQVSGTLTICTVELNCGFKVVGKSACLNPNDFNLETGKKLALRDAINQLWELEGYAQMRFDEMEK